MATYNTDYIIVADCQAGEFDQQTVHLAGLSGVFVLLYSHLRHPLIQHLTSLLPISYMQYIPRTIMAMRTSSQFKLMEHATHDCHDPRNRYIINASLRRACPGQIERGLCRFLSSRTFVRWVARWDMSHGPFEECSCLYEAREVGSLVRSLCEEACTQQPTRWVSWGSC